jgi:hypothetical protein
MDFASFNYHRQSYGIFGIAIDMWLSGKRLAIKNSKEHFSPLTKSERSKVKLAPIGKIKRAHALFFLWKKLDFSKNL